MSIFVNISNKIEIFISILDRQYLFFDTYSVNGSTRVCMTRR